MNERVYSFLKTIFSKRNVAISKELGRVTLEDLNEEAFPSRNTQIINFLSSQRESNLNDLSSIAEWYERPTRILEGHGFDYRWVTQKIYFLSNSI